MGIYENTVGILKSRKTNGFSLIELLIVIAMLAVLFLGLVLTFNPLTQLNKAKDGQRQHDLGQIQRALDSYFNDTHCYPPSLIFGTSWVVNGQVFMEKIPQDPDCKTNPSKCYVYEADPSSCPQWNVLYAAMRGPLPPANACPLVTRNSGGTACLPQGFTANKYNYCVLSGNINCADIAASTIGGGTGGTGGGGGGVPTPTPTLPASCPNNQYFGCAGDNRCNSIAPNTQCTQFGGTVNCVCDPHCNQMCAFN